MDPSYKTDVRIIVTRPVAQSDRLSAMISDAGGTSIRIPALEIRSTDHPEIAKEVFARVGEFQSVLFISPNAVRHSLQFVEAADLDKHQCIAIGASTAQAMTQAGIRCDVYPKENFTSEALLDLPELQQVSGDNILIVRGNGGRALLGNELANRGANIAYAEVYQRQVPEKSASLLNELLSNDGADVLIANSGETLSNILGIVDPRWLDALLNMQLVTGSARVAQAAINAGFVRPPVVADAPDDQSLMQAILRWSASDAAATDDAAGHNTESAGADSAADADEHSSLEAANNTQGTATSTDTEQSGHTPVELYAQEETAMTDESTSNKPDSESDKGLDAKTSGLSDDDASSEPRAEHDSSDDAMTASVPAPVMPAAQKRSGGGIAWLALFTALLAVAGTAWNWWHGGRSTNDQAAFDVASLNIPTGEEISAQVKQLSQAESGRVTRQLEQQRDSLEGVRNEQSSIASQLRTQKRSVENLTDELTQMSDSISAMRGVSASVRNTWVRAETEYFLQTANTRLQLAGDIKSATQALRAADERIVALGDPSLTPVRAQLSEDLLALESLPYIDIEGIALTLNALAGRVTGLPLRNEAARNFTRDGLDERASNSEDGAWTKIKSAMSDTVGSFVRVSPNDDAGAVLLAPEQAYFLYRNLELQLQAARIAALQSKQAVYDDSLASSKAWLEEYFDLDDTGVETVLGRIIELQGKTIELELPDISRSLNLIRTVAPVRRSSGGGVNQTGANGAGANQTRMAPPGRSVWQKPPAATPKAVPAVQPDAEAEQSDPEQSDQES